MSKRNSISKGNTKRQVLEPLMALEFAMTSSSIDEAWARMSGMLSEAGYDGCAFAISRRSIEAPVGHPDTRVWGSFVSDDFVLAMASHPDVQKLSPLLLMLRKTARPIAVFDDSSDRVSQTGDLADEYNGMMDRFGIKGRVLVPFHAPSSDCLMAVGWWDFEDSAKAKEKWQCDGGAFSLAATYFCQGILDHFSPLSQQQEELSVRERECLLWAAAGRRTSEIAQILDLADATVNEYLARAMKKLGARTRTEACAKALTAGILSN